MPNFFIVGAPKCGTTALFSYLAEHPAVFVPAVKEPHFYAKDLHDYTWITDEAQYHALFSGVSPAALAVGEASVFYLYSKSAAFHIRRVNPDARLIVMVRQPVDMFLSLHNQMRATLWEDQQDPEQAWQLQGPRLEGLAVPRHCDDVRKLQYGPICALGAQVARLLEVFPPEQVQVVVFDDLIRATAEVYGSVLRFLDLPPDPRTDFPPVNLAHRPRWPRLAGSHRRLDRALRAMPDGRVVRALLRPLRPASRLLRAKNTRLAPKGSISPTFREELMGYFDEDITRLERVIGRDLSAWRLVSGDGGTQPSV